MSSFRALFMEARPDWNKIGPRLPAWFKPRMQRIDPMLVPQFIPPQSVDPEGTRVDHYPHGMWVICRRLPRTGLLHKRWVWCLSDEKGSYRKPGHDTLALIRKAYKLFKAGRGDVLEKQFDSTAAAAKKERCEKNKAIMGSKAADAMRKLGFRSFGRRRVSLNGASIPN